MRLRSLIVLVLGVAFLVSCSKTNTRSTSTITGWEYPDLADNKNVNYQQQTGPGLVYIEGGTFTMGRVQEDVMFRWDNQPRRITVASFYMNETEVRNIDYRQYLYWISNVYPGDRDKLGKALPDTLVWRSELAYNEPYINNYLRHPAYNNYPVVGVSWIQANDFCKWRTDRVNEKILVDQGMLAVDNDQQGQNVFTTETYLSSMYEGKTPEAKRSFFGLGKTQRDTTQRRIRWEDGMLLPSYRLPTEAEWEYAALSLVGNANGEVITDRKIYPWSGSNLRSPDKKTQGRMKANFTRGRGDMMGMAGALNDNADITAPVNSYDPNDYGLFCMAGNVNEWVADVYRPLSNLDIEEFQPYRGNVFTNPAKDENGNFIRDEYGNLKRDTILDSRNFKDGSFESQIVEGDNWVQNQDQLRTEDMYIQGAEYSSLITDRVRVYKGGSWKDRPYWLIPGTRRYLDQESSANDIGFRCAMTRVGSPNGF